MRIIAHEMLDGSVSRTTSFEPTLAWLMANRTAEDVEEFVAAQMVRGASEQDARRIVVLMHDVDREIKNRGGTSLAQEWAYGLRDGRMTESSALDLIARISCPNAVRYVEVAQDSLPENLSPYRAALKLDGDVLGWDMPKMRDEHRKILRHARIPKFIELDIAYQRADENGDVAEKRRIAAKKQVLRDITAHPGIEAAQTPDELISVGVMLIEVQP